MQLRLFKLKVEQASFLSIPSSSQFYILPIQLSYPSHPTLADMRFSLSAVTVLIALFVSTAVSVSVPFSRETGTDLGGDFSYIKYSAPGMVDTVGRKNDIIRKAAPADT